jgi:signal transduction histidine kinase/HAMP domain-containing protein/ActR/RegA family two-component response regulator
VATQRRTRATTAAPRSRRSSPDGRTARAEAAEVAEVSSSELQELLEALRAAKRGERGIRIDARRAGIAGELGKAFNELAHTRERTTDEMVRLATEIGRAGRLTERLSLRNAEGTWLDQLESVNSMIEDLVRPTREVARVIEAVADGDLGQRIQLQIEGRPVKGEFLRIGKTVNAMVDQLSSFTDEVTRVAREVGTEGKLGGQARVKGVSGTWKDLTDNVNQMASNLTAQVRNIAEVTTAVANGDLTKKITADVKGEVLELKNTINTMVDQLSSFADEVTRVAGEAGNEGKLGGQAVVRGVSGTWKDLTDSVNSMAQNLTTQVRNIAEVTTAVADGDLTRKITVQASGEVAALAETINRMVDQLSSFADEVTRVAREVGTEGILGGQADVKGVSGTWKDLTDSVNGMANNLTTQVRNIAEVTTAVANGDLTAKITVDARGEVLELKRTINTMVDQLSSFAAEVTRVAKEVGTEGILGGQANVEGVSGVWEGLTDNVNQLARTLTTQLRAIANVSTAVTQGDLTRAITVEARGEVEELKNNINQMITNLRETTEVNANQAWLNTNMARFSGMLQGQRDLTQVSRLIMSQLTPLVGAQHGAFFVAEADEHGEPELRLVAGYGFARRDRPSGSFRLGETLVGQAALERKAILLTQAPPDYISISSGLGASGPANVIMLPILFDDRVMAVVEIASFQPFTDTHMAFLEQVSEMIGVVLNTIVATMRTEELLEQSQSLTGELQWQSEELQKQRDELERANVQLEERAHLLAEQNARIEQKNAEVESARVELEAKAEQLALSSSYKSEFLANMSHELRTPLNSLLILAKLLADNEGRNLSDEQVEFAQTIYNAGTDLLNLINDILDLSKVEAGKMDVDPVELEPAAIVQYVERSFRPVADSKGLAFDVRLGPGLPATMFVDEHRLQQILKNLLSNAFKFTERGGVSLTIEPAPAGQRYQSRELASADEVIGFRVTDTGIGISDDKLKLIFEAFQQADGTTSRRYGGTGLGLSISRDVGHLLGGEVMVEAQAGVGSTFTLFLPARYPGKADVLADDGSDVSRTALPGTSNGREFDPAGLIERALGDHGVPPRRRARRRELEDVPEHVAILSGKKVLLADDDARSAFALASVLERNGVEVSFAENALEAVEALHASPGVDLVLIDVMTVGDFDGYEAMRMIRKEARFADLPIISLAASAHGDDRAKSIESGATACLTKPVDPDDVVAGLQAWLKG